MRKKGKGYDPVDAVTEAVEKCGWTPEKFFNRAEEFAGKRNGFNPMAATEEFKAIRVNRTVVVEHMISSAVIAFSDWVAITDIRSIQARFRSN